MIIDCGCGGNTRGDVNIDLHIYESPDTTQYIDVKKIKNFINCSVTNLPLRSEIGDVICYHTIEHIFNVNDAINELKRVAINKVVIVVPNNPIMNEHHKHLYSWSRQSISNYLKCFFSYVETKVSTLKFIKVIHRLVIIVPLPFFLRRRIYQLLTNIVGHDLIAICKKRV